LISVAIEIATHKRFGKCGSAETRRWGHFFLLWGFVGAAVTSALLILAMYGLNEAMPLAQEHPFKILGNVSAVFLVLGSVWLLFNRLGDSEKAGSSSSFDVFFLGVVLLVVFSGVFTEAGRYIFEPPVACWLYIIHLGSVLCLFLTFPYSKFAHLMYRTLAMVHERMAQAATQPAEAPEKTPAETAPQEAD
jgi:quinone-modifying oxidoreductase subunit QmoC